MQRFISGILLIFVAGLGGCSKEQKPDARIVVTSASHDELLKTATKPVVLDFWATWCGPCRMMDPVFAEVSSERPDVIFGKVNVDEQPDLAQRYNVRAIPTTLIFIDGKVVKSSVGVVSKADLIKQFDEAIKSKATK